MKKYFSFPVLFLALFITIASGFVYTFAFQPSVQEEKTISMEEYNKRVSDKEKTVLVYFHADWCLVCRKMEPTINAIEAEYAGKLEVLRIDTERDKEITDTFEVDALPLLIFYRKGQKQWIHFGLLDKDALLAKTGKL